MHTRASMFEALEDRRLFSVAIGSIAAETVNVPNTPLNTVDRRAKVRLTAQGVTASAGDRVVGVTYFTDENQDGLLDKGDKVIGRGKDPGKDFAISRFIGQGTNLNTLTISAVARGRDGKSDLSPVVNQAITLQNGPPTIRRLVAVPHRVHAGGTLTLRADGVDARDGEITGVEFFQDTNGNGQIDSADLDLGAGTRLRTTRTWTFKASAETAGLPRGATITFLAQATDASGGVSPADAPPAVTVTVV